MPYGKMGSPDPLSSAMGESINKQNAAPVEPTAPEDNVVEVATSSIPKEVNEGDEITFLVASKNGDMLQLVYSPQAVEEKEAEGLTAPASIGSVAGAMDQAMKTE
jgi:hypothetical protein